MSRRSAGQASLDADWLKQLVLDAGADDVGFVEIGRPELDDQRDDILKAFPRTKTLISFVVRMNREADPHPGPVGGQHRIPPCRR